MPKQSAHFFARESDGSVRVRVRFTSEEASMIEEAASSTPIMAWMHSTIKNAARDEVKRQRDALQKFAPPSA